MIVGAIMKFLKFLEKILIILLAIIFAIPYFIYRHFRPKQSQTEGEQEQSKAKSAPKVTKQAKQNAFNTLEIAPTDDIKTIKSAYRNLVKKYHPDHNGNSHPLPRDAPRFRALRPRLLRLPDCRVRAT